MLIVQKVFVRLFETPSGPSSTIVASRHWSLFTFGTQGSMLIFDRTDARVVKPGHLGDDITIQRGLLFPPDLPRVETQESTVFFLRDY